MAEIDRIELIRNHVKEGGSIDAKAVAVLLEAYDNRGAQIIARDRALQILGARCGEKGKTPEQLVAATEGGK